MTKLTNIPERIQCQKCKSWFSTEDRAVILEGTGHPEQDGLRSNYFCPSCVEQWKQSNKTDVVDFSPRPRIAKTHPCGMRTSYPTGDVTEMGTGIMHDLILVVDWLSRFRGWDPNATGIDAVGQEAAERLRKAIKS